MQGHLIGANPNRKETFNNFAPELIEFARHIGGQIVGAKQILYILVLNFAALN